MFRPRGRPLLDPEALSCLLVLLFIDESRLNTQRLHKVLRNLSFHPPTRHWVVHSLLSILHRTAESSAQPAALDLRTDGAVVRAAAERDRSTAAEAQTAQENTPQTLVVMDNTGGGGTGAQSAASDQRPIQPNWLSMSLDAALGCRANIFHLQPTTRPVGFGTAGKRTTHVTVHPQASPVVCRHVLDALISLSKSFPAHFLPQSDRKAKEGAAEDSGAKQGSSRSAPAAPLSEFWDLIVKLDSQTASRKGKSSQRPHTNNSSYGDDNAMTTFNTAPIGQLMGMLAHPVLRRSQALTDKLLRLLGQVSSGVQDAVKNSGSGAPLQQPQCKS